MIFRRDKSTSVAALICVVLMIGGTDAVAGIEDEYHIWRCTAAEALDGSAGTVTGKQVWFSAIYSLPSFLEGPLLNQALKQSEVPQEICQRKCDANERLDGFQRRGFMVAYGAFGDDSLNERMFREHISNVYSSPNVWVNCSYSDVLFGDYRDAERRLKDADDESPRWVWLKDADDESGWVKLRQSYREEFGTDVKFVFTNWKPPFATLVKELDLKYADSGVSSKNDKPPIKEAGKVWDEEVSPEAQAKLDAWMDQNDISASRDLASTLALTIQTALALQNFDPGPRDGVLGPKTIAALLAWQAMAGWAASGDLAGTLNAVLRTALALQGYQLDPGNPLFGRHAHKIMDAWGSQHGSALGTADRDRQFWGAFAYSRTRDGWSAGSISGRAHRAIAVRAALDSCRKSKWGDNCKEILAFSDGCGALAVGKARGYGVATGRTRPQAERNALSECRRAAANCEVRKKLTTCNPAVDRFESQALSDFRVTVPAGQREVELCVRDHECEDGDRISVTVNGAQVFSGELYNPWSCHTVPVQPGANPISMFAINGTGFKGSSCSHENVNTGEMRVTGTNSATQSWRHRGGAGSSAQITVQVQ